jgi:hypothetical protein
MAKQKWYVALVDWTNKKITYAEDYTDKDEAIRRVQFGLEPEAMQYQMGMGGREVADVQAYGPTETAFAFPEEASEST